MATIEQLVVETNKATQHNRAVDENQERDASEQAAPPLAEADAVLADIGGLSNHQRQYEGRSIADCPFLASMGAAGVEMVQRLQAAEMASAPRVSRAERLAAKRASQAAATPSTEETRRPMTMKSESFTQPPSYNVDVTHTLPVEQIVPAPQPLIRSVVEQQTTQSQVIEMMLPPLPTTEIKADTLQTPTPVSHEPLAKTVLVHSPVSAKTLEPRFIAEDVPLQSQPVIQRLRSVVSPLTKAPQQLDHRAEAQPVTWSRAVVLDEHTHSEIVAVETEAVTLQLMDETLPVDSVVPDSAISEVITPSDVELIPGSHIEDAIIMTSDELIMESSTMIESYVSSEAESSPMADILVVATPAPAVVSQESVIGTVESLPLPQTIEEVEVYLEAAIKKVCEQQLTFQASVTEAVAVIQIASEQLYRQAVEAAGLKFDAHHFEVFMLDMTEAITRPMLQAQLFDVGTRERKRPTFGYVVADDSGRLGWKRAAQFLLFSLLTA